MEETASLHEDKVAGSAAMVGIWSGRRSRVAFVRAEGRKWIGKAVVVVTARVEMRESRVVLFCLVILLDGFFFGKTGEG